jgi:hypothetical protein
MKTKLTLALAAAVVAALVAAASAQNQFPPAVPVPPQPPRMEPPAVPPPPGVFSYGASLPRYPGAVTVLTSPAEFDNLSPEINQVMQQIGETKSDSDRDKLKTKLSDLLEKQFDVRQKRHEKEIEALEAQVKKLKELVQKRQENRRDIVAKRLEQLVRDAQGLGW